MNLSFLPGDLHLSTNADGLFVVTVDGQAILRTKSQRSVLSKFNALRSELERKFPTRVPTPAAHPGSKWNVRPGPPLDFDHLVECFKSRFPDGFEGQDFHDEERGYKEEAAGALKEKLGKEIFENLLHDGHYAGVCEIAKRVMRSTNLVYPIEKAKLVDGIENVANQERFAKALYALLHDSVAMEQPFVKFCNLLSEMGANKWPIATYYQFLATDGKWMFMKPSIMKGMAESLKISLNYKAEPNWLTYSNLQELADRVDLELKNRKLTPHSRIDVQGFIWASIEIGEGKYGKE